MRALLALLMASLAAPAAADPDYAAPGPAAVREADSSWTDPSRGRDLPLRIRLPEAGERLPVIVFSHGLGGSRAGGLEWSRHWASHGFALPTPPNPTPPQDQVTHATAARDNLRAKMA